MGTREPPGGAAFQRADAEGSSGMGQQTERHTGTMAQRSEFLLTNTTRTQLWDPAASGSLGSPCWSAIS